MRKSFFKLVVGILLMAVIGVGSYVTHQWFVQKNQNYLPIRVAESEPDIRKLPHYLAKKESFYHEQKLRIKTVECQDDREALVALETGKADVAFIKSSSLIMKRASDLKEGAGPVAFASLDRGTAYYLVAREEKPLTTIQSLKEKTVIAGPQDSMETVFLENSLRDAGISPYESVTIITNIPEEIKFGALKSGTGHYLLVEERDLSPALSRGFYQVQTLKTNFPTFVCVTTEDFIKKHPLALQKFTDALYMAQIWIKHKTPAETAAVVKSIPETDKNTFSNLLNQVYRNKSLAETPAVEAKDMDLLIQSLDRSRELPMPLEGSMLVVGRFAEQSVKTVQYIPQDDKKTFWDKLKFWETWF